MQTRIRRTVLALLTVVPAWLQATAGNSYAPILGYDDKNGLLYGAAAFHYNEGPQGDQIGGYGVTNGRDLHSLTLQSEQQRREWRLSAHARVARTFDNYFGEGDGTPSDAQWRVDQNYAEMDSAALRQVAPSLGLGPSLGVRLRQETGVRAENGATAPERAFADETTPALGLRACYDSRDSELSSNHGRLLGLDLRALPAVLARGGDGEDAWQGEAQWREFTSLPVGVVLGQRLAGGGSLGQPSYEERYTLGGTGELRGFQDNRFRGRDYYCLQEELRVPVYRHLAGAVGMDLGDASDGRLGAPRRSLQAGVRLGLPPSYGVKARLDLGYADSGERSLALQFGEAF